MIHPLRLQLMVRLTDEDRGWQEERLAEKERKKERKATKIAASVASLQRSGVNIYPHSRWAG